VFKEISSKAREQRRRSGEDEMFAKHANWSLAKLRGLSLHIQGLTIQSPHEGNLCKERAENIQQQVFAGVTHPTTNLPI
jgi:hypothetical protein